MKLAALLIFGILQFISSIKCSSYVLITGNEREKEVRIYRNSGKLFVSLEIVPFQDYRWLLENEKEVFQSSLEPINLVSTNDGEDFYTTTYNSGKVVTFEFSIPETDEAFDNLPSTLKFVYKAELSSSRANPMVEVHAVVHLNPVYDVDRTTYYDSIYIKDATSREDTIRINPDEPFMVSFYENLTSGVELNLDNYSWYLDYYGNNPIGKVVDNVELMDVGSTGIEDGANYFFIFRATGITDKNLLPRLHFILKKNHEAKVFKQSYVINLRFKSDTSISVFNSYNLENVDREIHKQFNFTREEILALEFRVIDPFYGWYLTNVEEVRASSGLDLINVNNRGSAPSIIDNKRMDDSYSTTIFRLRATETTPIGDIQPTLQFIFSSYSRDEILLKVDITLHLNQSTSVITTTTTTITTTITTIDPTSEPTLNCFASSGYPCCTDPHTKVVYHDDEGDWGVENKEWCFIPVDQEEKKEDDDKKDQEPQLIRICNSEKYGYSCCKTEQKVVYTDSQGDWGIEDGNWCGIYSCVYTGDYPVCKETTKVMYTDTEKWGVEHGEWCVLCS
ncbi:hypothetical protein BCR32DRAFT_229746 [Anaeromyces robustus]|uniref:CBM10 domain-containing protein n=1 Tax=Anaeromyces robustus TaxID=1754192 RepID=A0A1Y1XI34_9FUNG|nr:hypothetical protein BCR32DRAFT_229746 [Anaeromyces robustus]|eukprot:ORX85431.1 hypothetical protein BCR32DRAFT_229746 [Anaeromyces robustus]